MDQTGALYYTETELAKEAEVEVKEFVNDQEWDAAAIGENISEEMQRFILNNINPPKGEALDKA